MKAAAAWAALQAQLTEDRADAGHDRYVRKTLVAILSLGFALATGIRMRVGRVRAQSEFSRSRAFVQ